jgi:outer membrane murein-binding lipoprotein Lpp
MKRGIVLLLIAAIAVTGGAEAATKAQLAKRLAALEAQMAEIKSDLNATKKSVSKVKTHDAGDNIKWGVDLRTSIDSINYEIADGAERSKSDLMTTRLWLNMAYAPDENNIFKGQLAYNKAFGADMGNMRGFTMDRFDWVTNESVSSNELKVRQAYWLYMDDALFGADIPWTMSFGRRPSTNGFLANLRDDDEAQSPLGHNINVEFDGASSRFDLENVTGISGMSFKICAGQGSTNAKPRFNNTGTDYDADNSVLDDSKLLGFIFVPYDDGQFKLKTTAFRAWNMPGYSEAEMGHAMMDPTYSPNMSVRGNMDGAAISLMIDGLTEDGLLEDTKVFGSFAWSKTRPDAGSTMLGSTKDESGTSYWVGIQQALFDGKGKIGLEYNHGSEYWRPFTYGEDTMIGSKLAARGDALEAYFTYQMSEALSFQLRYTAIDYEYTGSNGFFGASGTPTKIDDIKAGAAAGDPMATAMSHMVVDKAQNIRAYVRYRF